MTIPWQGTIVLILILGVLVWLVISTIADDTKPH